MTLYLFEPGLAYVHRSDEALCCVFNETAVHIDGFLVVMKIPKTRDDGNIYFSCLSDSLMNVTFSTSFNHYSSLVMCLF